MSEICKLLEIRKTYTTPYRPQSDGLVERFNRTLIGMLSKFCEENQEDWDDHLPYVACAYRASVNDSTRYTPNQLMLGRETTLPIDLMFGPPDDVPFNCESEYVEWVRESLTKCFRDVRDHLNRAAKRQKKYYDPRTKDHDFDIGQLVWRYHTPLAGNKLNRPFTGPYVVTERKGEVAYSIRNPESQGDAFSVHADHLKAFRGPAPVTKRVKRVNSRGTQTPAMPADRPHSVVAVIREEERDLDEHPPEPAAEMTMDAYPSVTESPSQAERPVWSELDWLLPTHQPALPVSADEETQETGSGSVVPRPSNPAAVKRRVRFQPDSEGTVLPSEVRYLPDETAPQEPATEETLPYEEAEEAEPAEEEMGPPLPFSQAQEVTWEEQDRYRRLQDMVEGRTRRYIPRYKRPPVKLGDYIW
jgi:hypothetical protein